MQAALQEDLDTKNAELVHVGLELDHVRTDVILSQHEAEQELSAHREAVARGEAVVAAMREELAAREEEIVRLSAELASLRAMLAAAQAEAEKQLEELHRSETQHSACEAVLRDELQSRDAESARLCSELEVVRGVLMATRAEASREVSRLQVLPRLSLIAPCARECLVVAFCGSLLGPVLNPPPINTLHMLHAYSLRACTHMKDGIMRMTRAGPVQTTVSDSPTVHQGATTTRPVCRHICSVFGCCARVHLPPCREGAVDAAAEGRFDSRECMVAPV